MILRSEDVGIVPCREVDSEVFFPKPGQRKLTVIAQALCARCPVCAECHQAGVDGNEFGIWGGTTASERGREEEW